MFRPEDNEDLIGKWWRHNGHKYQLTGIMFDNDDWWWLMARNGKLNKHTKLLSCCLNIERYNFELIDV